MVRKLSAAMLALIVLLSALVIVYAAPVPSRSKDLYVSDYADIIDYEYEYKINSEAAELYEKYSGLQIVILTVNSIEDENIGEFAKKVYSSWKIGNDNIGNGLILVYSKDEGNYWALTGQGIAQYFTQSELKGILNDSFEKSEESENISESFYSFFTAAKEKMISATNSATANPVKVEYSPNGLLIVVIAGGSLILVFIIVVLIIRSVNINAKKKRRKARHPGKRPPTRRV